MLVQQQQLGLFQGRHQQGDCLALAAGKQTDLAGDAVLQAQAQSFKQLMVLGIFLFGNTNAQGAVLPRRGQGQIFFNSHGCSGARHGVLEHTANISGAFMFGRLVTSLPSIMILPGSTGHTPATAFSMVDFPAPLPPITVTKSPSFR